MNYITIKNASKGFVSVVGIKAKHLHSKLGVITDLGESDLFWHTYQGSKNGETVVFQP